MQEFNLPNEITALVEARNKLKDSFNNELAFSFDGKLVGDLGEAIAAQIFGLDLSSEEGVDAYAKDGRTVQVKATGGKNGRASFRNTSIKAEHFLFFRFEYEELKAELVYNGPENIVRATLPSTYQGQKQVSLSKLRKLNSDVKPEDRLEIIYNP